MKEGLEVEVCGEVWCSLHSSSFIPQGGYRPWCLAAWAWRKGNAGNVTLSFLNSVFLISVLHPGVVISHLESLALVKVFFFT